MGLTRLLGCNRGVVLWGNSRSCAVCRADTCRRPEEEEGVAGPFPGEADHCGPSKMLNVVPRLPSRPTATASVGGDEPAAAATCGSSCTRVTEPCVGFVLSGSSAQAASGSRVVVAIAGQHTGSTGSAEAPLPGPKIAHRCAAHAGVPRRGGGRGPTGGDDVPRMSHSRQRGDHVCPESQTESILRKDLCPA